MSDFTLSILTIAGVIAVCVGHHIVTTSLEQQDNFASELEQLNESGKSILDKLR